MSKCTEKYETSQELNLNWDFPTTKEAEQLSKFFNDYTKSSKLRAQYGRKEYVYLKMVNYDHAAAYLLETIMLWFMYYDYIHISKERLEVLGIPPSSLTKKFKIIYSLPFITKVNYRRNNERGLQFNFDKFILHFYENRVPY